MSSDDAPMLKPHELGGALQDRVHRDPVSIPTTTVSSPWCLARTKAHMDGATFNAPFLDRGSAVHEAAQAATREAYNTSPSSGTVMAAAMGEVHRWQLGDHPLPDDQFFSACQSVETMLGPDSSIYFGRAGPGRTTDTERTFYLDEAFQPVLLGRDYEWSRYGENDERIAYAFTVDRIDWPLEENAGVVEVVDFKDGLKRLSKGEAPEPQAPFYSFGILQHVTDHDTVKWKTALTRFGYTVGVRYTRDESRLRWARDLMRVKRERVRRAAASGEWPATPGDDCSLCPIQNRCEAFADAGAAAMHDTRPSPFIAAAYAGDYLALKPYVANLERELKKHADTVGPIPTTPGSQWGYFTKERNELALPVLDALDGLADLGATAEELRKWFPGDRVSRGSVLKALEKLAPHCEDGMDPKVEILNFYEKRTYQTAGVFPREIEEES